MRTVKVTLGKEIGCVEIHTLADWHIGDKHCDINSIKNTLQYIQGNKYSYVICNGDLMNNASKTSVSDIYAEDIPPMKQLETLCELLYPIKDRILLITQGNHEARTWKQDGIDLTALMAQQLGIYDRYVREGGVLFLRFGEDSARHRRECYTFYVTHGSSGGGKREGGKVNSLSDLASIIDCDIYLHGHTHLPIVMKQNFYRLDNKNSYIAEVEKLFVNTASAIRYGGYGQTYGFKPSNNTSPIIYLNGKRKEFSAKL